MPLLTRQVNYDILGEFIEASKGSSYIDNIPKLTRENIEQVGNAIIDYEPAKEAFYNSFLVKITLQLFEGFTASNRFKFLKGPMTKGDIEDAYVDYIKSENFDGEDENPFPIKKADVKVLYHKVDRRLRYDTTVTDEQLMGAFTNEYGLNNLISRVIASLYSSNDYDEYTMFKQLLVDNFDKGYHVPISGEDAGELSNNLLYEMKRLSQDLTFVSDKYNSLNVKNSTSFDNQIIVLHKDYSLDIDMGVLANTFNVDKMKLDSQVIIVDNFNDTIPTGGEDETNIVACIFDKRGVRFWDQMRRMTTQYNPKALYTNYFLHVWNGLSYAYFHNLVYFTEPEIGG